VAAEHLDVVAGEWFRDHGQPGDAPRLVEQRQRGAPETVQLLRGMLTGFGAFALFCFALAVSLPALSVASAFALATSVALLTQAAMIRRSTRRVTHWA